LNHNWKPVPFTTIRDTDKRKQRPASLHHLHVTPKPCRLRWQLLRRHPERPLPHLERDNTPPP